MKGLLFPLWFMFQELLEGGIIVVLSVPSEKRTVGIVIAIIGFFGSFFTSMHAIVRYQYQKEK